MAEPSIWDFIEDGPALPPESCRTLDRFDGEKRAAFERFGERAVEAVWSRHVDLWLAEETAVVARALSIHFADSLRPDDLVLSLN
jgi:hypothetical protein